VPLVPEHGFLPDLDRLSPSSSGGRPSCGSTTRTTPPGGGAPEFFRRALELSAEYGFWLASDEAYSEIYFDDPPPGALQFGLEGLVVFNTLSKRSAMTGYRSGLIAGDPGLVRLLRKVRPSQGVATPAFIMEAAIEAWSDEEHVAGQRRIYREKREALLPVLRRAGIEIGGSAATFYLYLRSPRD